MSTKKYLDFDLLIEAGKEGYRVRVLNSPAGNASQAFTMPFNRLEVENFILRLGAPRRGVRRVETQEMEAAKDFGGRLYKAVFDDAIQGALRSSLDAAGSQGAGLRIRLTFDDPELASLPWEYLYNPALNRFLSLSPETPIVRYLELPERIKPLSVKPPLRVLVMISSPMDDNFEPLEIEREWVNITKAMHDLQQQKLVIIDRLEEASLPALRRQLRKYDYHIFHFVGHGVFDIASQDGLLVLENDQKQGELVSGQDLGIILHGHDSLRLAVINACEGARSGVSDPYAGVAQSLVQQGIPAVIAMQFSVTDKAAITFAHEFYNAITSAYPVDASLAEARRAIYSELKNIEWATPVLFMRSPDGQIFDLPERSSGTQSGPKRPSANLFVRLGAQAGHNFPLLPQTYLIGRDETLTVTIQDGQVSRQHAKIVFNNLGFWIEDLDSRNGTFVNGMRITAKVPLRNGDVIRVGGTTLIFDQQIGQRSTIRQPLAPPIRETSQAEEEKEVKIATLWAEAQAARSQNRWDNAIANLQAILNLDPAHPKARTDLAYAQKQQKASSLYDEAQAAEARGDWATAIARLQAILNLEPGHTAIRNELAQIQQRQKAASLYAEAQAALGKNDFNLAAAKLQAVLAIEPTHPRARAELGVVQGRQRQQKIDSLYAEAQAALAQEDLPLGIAKLQAVLAVEPAHPQAREELNTLLQRQHQEKVGGLYEEVRLAQAQENWAMAVAKLQAILALEPGNQKIRFELGQAQKQQKIAALFAEARAAQAQGNWGLAVNKLQAVLGVDTNLAQARQDLETAQQNLQHQRAEALYTQGQAHYQAGRLPQALQCFYQIKSMVGEYKDVEALIGAIEPILGAQNLGGQPPLFQQPAPNWPAGGAGPQPSQPSPPESVGRVYEAPGVDRGQLSEELRQHFFINGYETQVIDQGSSVLIQGKKGGVRSWIGMGQAITIMLEDTGAGLKVSIGGGKWVEQGAAIAVGLFVLWPLLLTGGVGMLMQKNLIDTLWRMVENRIYTSGGKRIS